MLSAFGVDHGESSISKGVRLRLVRTPSKAAARVMTTGPKGSKTGAQKIAHGARKASEASISVKGIGEGTSRVGRGISGVIEQHPGLTGAALVGGGGAGGYKLISDAEARRRR